jgi:hypothetical protein
VSLLFGVVLAAAELLDKWHNLFIQIKARRAAPDLLGRVAKKVAEVLLGKPALLTQASERCRKRRVFPRLEGVRNRNKNLLCLGKQFA